MSRVKYLAHITLSLALFTGCTGTAVHSVSNDTNLFAVTAENAAFFHYGPQQGNGPDRMLSRNTLVRLIRSSWGYSKVQLIDDHEQGYVATEEISAAPANLIATANTTPTPSPAGEQFDLSSSDPRLNAPPENLPAPDLPAASDVAPASSPANQ